MRGLWENVKLQVAKHGLTFPTSKKYSGSPFTTQMYRPELDVSKLCDESKLNLYQNLIGVLRWVCELGRVDVLFETSLLSQYLAQPREGHLIQAINIFSYLDHHNRTWLVLDPTRFEVNWVPQGNEDSPQIRAQVMKRQYYDAEDLIPPNMPKPRGKAVDISIFVDADHAGNKVTRRSHTGVIIYVNMAPIVWYSKRQNLVESSTFGSEFMALKTSIELLDGLVFKLRMMGVPIDGPARVFCDNDSVVRSSTFPEVVLKRKTSSIAFHLIREAVAAEKILIYYERSSSNIADLFTKLLPKIKRRELVRCVLS